MATKKTSFKRSIKKNLNYFRFGLRGSWDSAVALLADYPMTARTENIEVAQLTAVNAILSNIPNGNQLIIRNFSKLKKDDRRLSRHIFLSVLNHLCNVGLMHREGKGYSRSVITYSNKIKRYILKAIIYYPESTIFTHVKGEDRVVAKINTEERREIKKRLKSWWGFIQQHEIDPGISTNDFHIFNECETLVFGKKPLIKPKHTDVLPYIIFNDRDLTKGGRMYGAFWIGMKKELRRAILIDGAKTCDIDGKGMYVQLLYRAAGEPLPDGDMYLYTDERRKITKGLMLLMMNTAKKFPPEVGRARVKSTYRKKNGHDEDLDKFILDLEAYHHKILGHLYKPNWGRLMKTEAAIMLNIMEAAMDEDIVVLPVHDGCMCKIEHRDRVLQLFAEQGIEAAEYLDHLKPVPIAETKALLDAFYRLKKVA